MMNYSPIQELYKTRKIPLVNKAYYSIDFKTVIVEVRFGLSAVDRKLYFEYGDFRADQVIKSIAELINS